MPRKLNELLDPALRAKDLPEAKTAVEVREEVEPPAKPEPVAESAEPVAEPVVAEPPKAAKPKPPPVAPKPAPVKVAAPVRRPEPKPKPLPKPAADLPDETPESRYIFTTEDAEDLVKRVYQTKAAGDPVGPVVSDFARERGIRPDALTRDAWRQGFSVPKMLADIDEDLAVAPSVGAPGIGLLKSVVDLARRPSPDEYVDSYKQRKRQEGSWPRVTAQDVTRDAEQRTISAERARLAKEARIAQATEDDFYQIRPQMSEKEAGVLETGEAPLDPEVTKPGAAAYEFATRILEQTPDERLELIMNEFNTLTGDKEGSLDRVRRHILDNETIVITLAGKKHRVKGMRPYDYAPEGSKLREMLDSLPDRQRESLQEEIETRMALAAERRAFNEIAAARTRGKVPTRVFLGAPDYGYYGKGQGVEGEIPRSRDEMTRRLVEEGRYGKAVVESLKPTIEIVGFSDEDIGDEDVPAIILRQQTAGSAALDSLDLFGSYLLEVAERGGIPGVVLEAKVEDKPPSEVIQDIFGGTLSRQARRENLMFAAMESPEIRESLKATMFGAIAADAAGVPAPPGWDTWDEFREDSAFALATAGGFVAAVGVPDPIDAMRALVYGPKALKRMQHATRSGALGRMVPGSAVRQMDQSIETVAETLENATKAGDPTLAKGVGRKEARLRSSDVSRQSKYEGAERDRPTEAAPAFMRAVDMVAAAKVQARIADAEDAGEAIPALADVASAKALPRLSEGEYFAATGNRMPSRAKTEGVSDAAAEIAYTAEVRSRGDYLDHSVTKRLAGEGVQAQYRSGFDFAGKSENLDRMDEMLDAKYLYRDKVADALAKRVEETLSGAGVGKKPAQNIATTVKKAFKSQTGNADDLGKVGDLYARLADQLDKIDLPDAAEAIRADKTVADDLVTLNNDAVTAGKQAVERMREGILDSMRIRAEAYREAHEALKTGGDFGELMSKYIRPKKAGEPEPVAPPDAPEPAPTVVEDPTAPIAPVRPEPGEVDDLDAELADWIDRRAKIKDELSARLKSGVPLREPEVTAEVPAAKAPTKTLPPDELEELAARVTQRFGLRAELEVEVDALIRTGGDWINESGDVVNPERFAAAYRSVDPEPDTLGDVLGQRLGVPWHETFAAEPDDLARAWDSLFGSRGNFGEAPAKVAAPEKPAAPEPRVREDVPGVMYRGLSGPESRIPFSELEGKTPLQVAEYVRDRAPSFDYRVIADRAVEALRGIERGAVLDDGKILRTKFEGTIPTPNPKRRRGSSFYGIRDSDEGYELVLRLDFAPDVDYETALHEVIHASTQVQVWMGSRKGAPKAMREAVDDLTLLRNRVVKAINDANAQAVKDGVVKDHAAYAFAKLGQTLQNEDEFIAYALTNRSFQEYLRNLEVTPVRETGWSKFVSIIQRLLGIPNSSRNVLSQTLRTTENLWASVSEGLPADFSQLGDIGALAKRTRSARIKKVGNVVLTQKDADKVREIIRPFLPGGERGPLSPFGGRGPEDIRRALDSSDDGMFVSRADPAERAAPDAPKPEAGRLWVEQGADSPYFRQWFGGSKVVDDEGKPLVVYHGTKGDFEEFETPSFFTEYAGEASAYTGAEQISIAERLRKGAVPVKGAGELDGARVPYVGIWGDIPRRADGEVWATDNGVVRRREDGVYEVFTDLVVDYGTSVPRTSAGASPQIIIRRGASDAYSEWARGIEEVIDGRDVRAAGGQVMPVYLSIQNPKEVDPFEANILGARLRGDDPELAARADALVERLKQEGYDGIVTRSDTATFFPEAREAMGGVPRQWIPFEPEQVKSATGNVGRFDPKSRSIRYREEADPGLLNGTRDLEEAGPTVRTVMGRGEKMPARAVDWLVGRIEARAGVAPDPEDLLRRLREGETLELPFTVYGDDTLDYRGLQRLQIELDRLRDVGGIPEMRVPRQSSRDIQVEETLSEEYLSKMSDDGLTSEGWIADDQDIEAARQFARLTDLVGKEFVDRFVRKLPALLIGGDSDAAKRYMPPRLRSLSKQQSRVISQRVGDINNILRDTRPEDWGTVEQYLGGEKVVFRISGRPVSTSGHDAASEIGQVVRNEYESLRKRLVIIPEDVRKEHKLPDGLAYLDDTGAPTDDVTKAVTYEDLVNEVGARILAHQETTPVGAERAAKTLADSLSVTDPKAGERFKLRRALLVKALTGEGANAFLENFAATVFEGVRPVSTAGEGKIEDYIAGVLRLAGGEVRKTDDGKFIVDFVDKDGVTRIKQTYDALDNILDSKGKIRTAVLIGTYGYQITATNKIMQQGLTLSGREIGLLRNITNGVRLTRDEYQEAIELFRTFGVSTGNLSESNQVLARSAGLKDVYLPEPIEQELNQALGMAVDREIRALMDQKKHSPVAQYLIGLNQLIKNSWVRGVFIPRARMAFLDLTEAGHHLTVYNTPEHTMRYWLRTAPQAITMVPGVAAVTTLPGMGLKLLLAAANKSRPSNKALQTIADFTIEDLRAALSSGSETVEKALFGMGMDIRANDILRGEEGVVELADGRVYNIEDWRQAAIETGVMSSFASSELAPVAARRFGQYVAPPPVGAAKKGPPETAAGRAMAAAGGVARRTTKFAAERAQEYPDSVAELAEAFSERSRLGAMLAAGDLGLDPYAAGRLVNQAMFDFPGSVAAGERISTVTGFVINLLTPFWTYQKNINRRLVDSVFDPEAGWRFKTSMRAFEKGETAVNDLVYQLMYDPYGFDTGNMTEDQRRFYTFARESWEQHLGKTSVEQTPFERAMFVALWMNDAPAAENTIRPAPWNKPVDMPGPMVDMANQMARGIITEFMVESGLNPENADQRMRVSVGAEELAGFYRSKPTEGLARGYERDQINFMVPTPATKAWQSWANTTGKHDSSYMLSVTPPGSIDAMRYAIGMPLAAAQLMQYMTADPNLAGGGEIMEETLPIDPLRTPLMAEAVTMLQGGKGFVIGPTMGRFLAEMNYQPMGDVITRYDDGTSTLDKEAEEALGIDPERAGQLDEPLYIVTPPYLAAFLRTFPLSAETNKFGRMFENDRLFGTEGQLPGAVPTGLELTGIGTAGIRSRKDVERGERKQQKEQLRALER